MHLSSDLFLNAAKLSPVHVSESDTQLNEKLLGITVKGPRWWEVGAPRYREMMRNNKTALPGPVLLPQAIPFSIPSREKERVLNCRLIMPEHGRQVKGVFMHIHGGGWVLMDIDYQDAFLQYLANVVDLAVISVGYRLAPEHPFPEGPEDCYDAAEWLVDNSAAHFGAPLKLAGGESAGAHLTMLSALHLLEARPNFRFRGLIPSFGPYDLSMPSTMHHLNHSKPILTKEMFAQFVDAFVPNTTSEERRHPSISPFYANLKGYGDEGRLPSVLFECGTEDCLLEDTVLMALRWQMAGGEAVVKLYSGAPHGFLAFPPEEVGNTRDGLEAIGEFLRKKIGN